MSKLEERYRLPRLLDGRRTGTSRDTLIRDHEFSRSTLARLIRDLRDKLVAPLIHDKERNGYRYDTADGGHCRATLYRQRPRWVADETSHPNQQSTWLPDGSHEPRIPYSDPRELIMGMPNYGAVVELAAPDTFGKAIKNLLHQRWKAAWMRVCGWLMI